jgi:Xaa-Pro aminopeptidase
VVDQRAVKAAEELDEIETAVNLTGQMHQAASAMARPGLLERDLVAAMAEICLAAGSQPAYPMILTVKGHVLHNTTCLNTLQEGDLVINDTGAESPGRYASDITRTFPVSGRFSTRQREVYEIVLSAQAEALEAIRPGVRFLDVHLTACRALASGLKALGLMTGDPAEAVAAGAHALFFQCGLGHMLGLDVHDMEDLGEELVGYDSQIQRSSQFGLRYLRMARELRPGFVLTVEPGLYFIPELIDMWRADNRLSAFLNYPAIEKFRDFTGVRVEDNVVVTAAGYRLLGHPIPKTAAGVEELTGLTTQTGERS